MPTIEGRIENEFKSAMKERDAVKVSTLRMLKAEINNLKLDENKNSLTDEEIMKIVRGQVKRHLDSIEQFGKGNRPDLVEKEKKELVILKGYMPEELPLEELKKIIDAAIKELGAGSKKDMGNVIKLVMERVKGRADGKTISQIVSASLS